MEILTTIHSTAGNAQSIWLLFVASLPVDSTYSHSLMLRGTGGSHKFLSSRRMNVKLAWYIVFATAQCVGVAVADGQVLHISPGNRTLIGAEARQQLLVTEVGNGREVDRTRYVQFESANPAVASVDPHGVVRAVGDGSTSILVRSQGLLNRMHVNVLRSAEALPVNFANDIVPVLSKAGCNAGSCHGKQSGQNGFKLSVFGFDPVFDYAALVSESRGRRIFPVDAEQSLLLQKAANSVPHGGGQKFPAGSTEYNRVLRWIKQGTPRGEPDDPKVVEIRITPTERVLTERSQQQVIVTAVLSDGTVRDVTDESRYDTNDNVVAGVDRHGLIQTTKVAGEAAIMTRYMEFVATCRVTVPFSSTDNSTKLQAAWKSAHFVDQYVAAKWRKLNLLPSARCDDATFLRRATLDVIGRLPTADDAREFLTSKAANKRTALIDSLLERHAYADYFALQWADLLRVNQEALSSKSAYVFDAWLRQAFRDNMPYDQFVRELITAQGSSNHNSATNFYKAFPKPNDLTIAVSQVFLGVRLEYARCHHHPYEHWGQDDFFGMAAFFPRLKHKKIADGDQLLFVSDRGDVKHPKTKAIVAPRTLLGKPLDVSVTGDRRLQLAEWMTSPNNLFVARTMANRVWAHFMGRGLVEPIDDMRATNPATNELLLAALAAEFVSQDFNIKLLIRSIMTSDVYQLSSQPNKTNVRDTRNYSRTYRKRLSAEVLLDAVCDVTGEPSDFAGVPHGTRAVQLWNNRLPSSFLDVFGRPQRKSVCECERLSETSLGQVMHLMNAPLVNDKISSPTGYAATLSRSDWSPEQIIIELYLMVLSRYPTQPELSATVSVYSAPDSSRRSATEDILWALINTAEFVLND